MLPSNVQNCHLNVVHVGTASNCRAKQWNTFHVASNIIRLVHLSSVLNLCTGFYFGFFDLWLKLYSLIKPLLCTNVGKSFINLFRKANPKRETKINFELQFSRELRENDYNIQARRHFDDANAVFSATCRPNWNQLKHSLNTGLLVMYHNSNRAKWCTVYRLKALFISNNNKKKKKEKSKRITHLKESLGFTRTKSTKLTILTTDQSSKTKLKAAIGLEPPPGALPVPTESCKRSRVADWSGKYEFAYTQKNKKHEMTVSECLLYLPVILGSHTGSQI